MDLALAIAVVFLLGLGYAAWRWLLRKLHTCEDRVEQLTAEREAFRARLAKWPPAEEADER